MVHRTPDSRLLVNLIASEKDHAKQLLALSDSSYASLASLSAYAAASPAPIAQVIFAVADALASADNALQLYAASVHEWRQHLKALKTFEDEVGNVVRDREILVTRVLKTSKTQKPSGLVSLPSTSISATSLRSDSSFTPTKLTAAQSELLACESHLAAKERELWECRTRTVREGLSARCSAMAECGRAWTELGNEAFKLLEGINIGVAGSSTDLQPSLGLGVHPSTSISVLSAKYQPIVMPRLSSDLTSLNLSQTHEDDTGSANQHPYANAKVNTNSKANWHSHIDNGDFDDGTNLRLDILPAHAVSEFVFPTSHEITPRTSSTPTPTAMTTAIPSLPPRVLPHRITEEDLHHNYSAEEGSSVEEEDVGPLQLVENSQFSTQPLSSRTHDTHPKRFFIRNVVKPDTSALAVSSMDNKTWKSSKSSTMPASSRFFGSLRLGALFRRDADLSNGVGGETRTAKNLKKMKAGSSDESTIVITPSPVSGSTEAPSVNTGGGRRLKKKSIRRTQRGAGVFPSSAQDHTSQDREEMVGGGEVDHDGPAPHDTDTVSDVRTSDKERLSRSSLMSRDDGTGTRASPTSNTGNVRDKTKRSSSVDVVRDRDANRRDSRLEVGASRRGRRNASLDGRSRSAVSSKEGPNAASMRGRRGGARSGLGRSDIGVDTDGPSLMSIVEGVTRQNREGWSKYVDTQEGVSGFGGSNPISFVDDREKEKLGNGSALLVVKAPPPVSRDELDVMVMKTSALGATTVEGIKSVGTGHPASRSAPSLIPPSAGEPAAFTNGEALLKLLPGATTKGRLKSALRNTSRTPSPSPLAASSLRTGGENGRGGGKKRRSVLALEGRNGSDDEASESSYETGHETFDGEEEGEKGVYKDRELPAPPPPNKPSYDRAAADGNTPSTTRREDLDQGHNGSDASGSTQTTEVVVDGRDQGTTSSVRRKSVRMSLKPTFSSTPPAIDDDASGSPWSRAGTDGLGGWESRVRYLRENVDMWEDSSEEDEEYQKARRLLIAKTR